MQKKTGDAVFLVILCLMLFFAVFPSLQTIGAAFVAKPIQVGEKVVTLGIWVS